VTFSKAGLARLLLTRAASARSSIATRPPAAEMCDVAGRPTVEAEAAVAMRMAETDDEEAVMLQAQVLQVDILKKSAL